MGILDAITHPVRTIKKVVGGLEPVLGLAGDIIGGSNSAKASQRMAEKQMKFQKKMSNTSYQRAVKDMAKAGLNPMLAYTQGGASTPSGAMGEAPDQSHIGSRAVANVATAAQVANLKAATAKTEAETLRTQEEWQGKLMENRVYANRYGVDAEKGPHGEKTDTLTNELEKLRQEAHRARADADLTNTNARVRRLEERIIEETTGSRISSARSAAELADKQVTYQELQNVLARLKIPEAEALAKWFDTVGAGSPAAKAAMSITQWLKIIFGK